MSYVEAAEPRCRETRGSIELRIEAQGKNLGDLVVRRALPSPERRMVGPFIFFDHMGPADYPPGKGIEVRPHPHIGLATITYLFEGEIMHRDSLGYAQPIRPGAVNLMTAGRGIVHSERAGEDLASASRLHGIQTWMALPETAEETEPAFEHYPAADLPELEVGGASVRVIVGDLFGRSSPVTSWSPTVYAECRMPEGSSLDLPGDTEELAVYVVEGRIRIDGDECEPGVMAVIAGDGRGAMQAVSGSRVMLIGGQALGHRHIWWNFVATSRERIARARRDWAEGRFAMVPGDDEFIPLPEK
jgi:hypothetical protein